MSSSCVAPPASKRRISKERRCRLVALRTTENLVESGYGYRAKKIIEFSARHYHDYRRVSCSRALAPAKRDIEECIKCGRHSWDTWHDKFRSVISLTYRPELKISPDDDRYPEELAMHKRQHLRSTGEEIQSPASFLGPGCYGMTEQRGLCYVCSRGQEDHEAQNAR